MKYLLIFFISLSTCFYTQNRELYGKINIQNSKENYKGNLIFKPKKNSVKIVFAQTDANGNYKAKLENEVAYTLEIPFLSNKKSTYEIDEKKSGQFDVELSEEKVAEIKEVNIKYQMPITIKEDTLIYKVSAFTNGTERKMADVVKKLPGFEVSKEGAVKVNGKIISGTLVEGSEFFNGNTSLAMKNLPADALSEIEVIDNYTENKIRGNSSSENNTVLNIKLKKEKKELWFGDAVLGGNYEGYYSGHLNLFKFSKKYNLNSIGDTNNIGDASLNVNDVFAMMGGVMGFVNNTRIADELDSNLFALAVSNPNFLKKSNQFLTSNFQTKTEKTKFDWNVMYLGNTSLNLDTSNKSSLNNEYKEETRSNSELSVKILQSTFKTVYNLNPSSVVTNFLSLKFSENQNNFTNFSKINLLNFNQSRDNALQNYQLKNNLSLDKSISKFLNLSAYLKIEMSRNTNNNYYNSDTAFLNNYVPQNSQNQYSLLNRFRNEKMSISLGSTINYKLTNLSKFIFEPLIFVKKSKIGVVNTPNYLMNGFLEDYQFRQISTSLKSSYLQKINQHEIKIGADLLSHFIEIAEKNTNLYDYFNVLGFLDYKYEWKPSHYLKLNYNAKTSFIPEVNYSINYNVLAFNQIIKFDANNSNLQNFSHNFGLKYLCNNLYYKYGYAFDASYSLQEKGFVRALDFSSTQALQKALFVFSENPNKKLNLSLDLNKEIHKINLYTNYTFETENNLQIINSKNAQIKNVLNLLKFGIQSKFKKIPWDFDVFYTKNWNETYSEFTTRFNSENISFESNLKFYKYFTFKLNATTNIIQNWDGTKKTFNNLNSSIIYDNPSKYFSYEIAANNLTNNSEIADNSIVSNFTLQTSKFVLPRIIVFKIMFSF